MIARIRRGNDFQHVWAINWNGQPEDFSDATDITLTAKVYGQVKTLTEGVDYIIDGNIVTIDFTPTICDITGTYTVELNYIKPSAEFVDGDRRSAVDVQAFQIVNTSAEANATEGVSLTSEALAIYALKYEDLSPENIAELQRPATEAAASVSALEQTVSDNEALRVTAEQDRVDTELIRVGAESARSDAEGLRNANEIARIESEGIRDANETDRINAENDRVDAEDLREQAEVAREEAEGLRQTNTTTAIQDAGEATTAANTAAGLANSAATTANTAAGNANSAATAANTAAGLADSAATTANTAAGNANDATTAANTAAGNANDATTAANTAAGLANSAATTANTAAESIGELEQTIEDNEAIRQSNESDRQIAEGLRQTNTLTAIQNANTAADNANEMSSHPPVIINDYWHNWNFTTNQYETTGQYARGDSAIEGSLVLQTTGQSSVDVMSQKAVTDELAQLAGNMYLNQFYGIEWDDSLATSAATRIGNQSLHASLPVHKKMRRCLLNDLGVVNYYLSATDSTKREDGRNAVLDGTDGQVMVELPAHYRKFETEGTKTRCLISEYPLSGYHFVPKAYRSAYEATVQRSNLKLSSVKNVTADFRGGNNTTTWDGTYRSLLGKPASSISLTDFRTYARNRGAAGQGGAGWNCDLYELQKTTFWLYAIEYANFNSQLPHNSALTAQGYRQGGLSDGVTTLASAAWITYNSNNPFIPCGYTNSLGNGSGIVPFAMPAEYGTALTVDVPSYRGLENPFGHLWHWTDGLRVRYTTAADGDLGELYVQLDPTKYNSEDLAEYTKRGLLPPSGGYIKSMITGEFGENMPATVGGTSTTYFADNHYQPARPPETELIRGVSFGGFANHGESAGLSFSQAYDPVSHTRAFIGSRLCFLP